MGMFYRESENKIRPGVYQRYKNAGATDLVAASDGVVAMTIKSNWGALGKVHCLTSLKQMAIELGDCEENGTVFDVAEAFAGGATTVKVVRLGTGGTKSVGTLNDTQSTPAAAVKFTAKAEGARAFHYALRAVLGDPTVKEFVLYERATVLEKFTFTAGEDEAGKLIAAAKDSLYFLFSRADGYMGTGALAVLANGTVTAGTNPTTTNEDYAAAFAMLETERWNTIAVDTDDAAVHALLAAYNDRVYTTGKMGHAVIGEPTTITLSSRQSHAKELNDYKVVYVGGGWYDEAGAKVEGHRAAARVAGMIAAIPSSESMTHRAVKGAVSTIEKLTNTQYEDGTNSGMLQFSTSAKGSVWIENGISTLVKPLGEDDEGWKKIKRTKIRFELMQRANDTVEPMVGSIPNDTDGRATIQKAVQGVLNAMIAERKLLPGAAIAVDVQTPPQADSAWFVITADDVDSLEKMYFLYQFRFTPTV